MSAQYLDDRLIGPSTDVYERLETVERAIENEVVGRANRDGRLVTYIQSGGDSRRYQFTLRLVDEKALEEASETGLLNQIAKIAYEAVVEHLELAQSAEIKFCFNSDEYVHVRDDGFARYHNGDWREDYVFVLDSKGNRANA